MHTLLRSVLDRDVDLDGVRFIVRSPTVREALQILASAAGTLTNEEVQRDVFFEALRSWFPATIVDTLIERGYPEARIVAFAFEAVNEGVPAVIKSDAEDDDKKETATHDTIDWESIVAEYMATYSISLADTLSEPWNGFLLLSQKADMVHARASLRIMNQRGVPYIKDEEERQEAIDNIVKRAGGKVLTKEERKAALRKERLDNQQAQLDILAGFMNSPAYRAGSETGKA